MLDYGASINVMYLKVMNQLGLKITRPYRNVCKIDSKANKVCGVIKDLKVHLATYLEVSLSMDVIVIDVHDACGMLLSRKWVAISGGSIQMDLSYATIPIGDGSYVTLYNHPMIKNHVKKILEIEMSGVRMDLKEHKYVMNIGIINRFSY
jgi:hypothetical protein